MRAVGIDLGASAVWAVAADDGRFADAAAFGVDEDELVRLRRWCGDAVVAIDAPGGPSEGRHRDDATLAAKFRPARCAEVALRRAGYAVPWVTGGPPFPPWVETGFAVYAALGDLERLEVYPHAVFAELLGQRPPPKSTPAGRRVRLDALAAAGFGLPPDANGWRHDFIDAAGACLVAVHHLAGRARRVACEDHDGGSPMWLPGSCRSLAGSARSASPIRQRPRRRDERPPGR